jgi:hypothetical protein
MWEELNNSSYGRAFGLKLLVKQSEYRDLLKMMMVAQLVNIIFQSFSSCSEVSNAI